MIDSVEAFLGSTTSCGDCGREHRVTVQWVEYGEEALEALAEHIRPLANGGEVALVADARTRRAAGERTIATLRRNGLRVREILVPDPAGGGDPVCDEATLAFVRSRTKETCLLVACGAGVINDLTKWASFEDNLPYAVVATAASMNGYVSANVAPLVDGVKTLVEAHEPVGVAALPSVLKQAPWPMTAAGLGDVIAKTVSTVDWYLNGYLLGEYYCPYCAGLVSEIEKRYTAQPEAIRERTDEGIGTLFEALILTGFSMTMAGTSAPASGGEHLISHSLDMMAMRDGVQHDLHGRQVGVGTLFCAALYQRVLAQDKPRIRLPEPTFQSAFWGEFAGAVAEKQRVKAQREKDVVSALGGQGDRWRRLRHELRGRAPSPETIKRVLSQGGAAHRLEDIGVDRMRFLEAVTHAHEMRERFTVLGLARCMGLLPNVAAQIVDEWLLE